MKNKKNNLDNRKFMLEIDLNITKLDLCHMIGIIFVILGTALCSETNVISGFLLLFLGSAFCLIRNLK